MVQMPLGNKHHNPFQQSQCMSLIYIKIKYFRGVPSVLSFRCKKTQKTDVDWVLGAFKDDVDGMEPDDGVQGLSASLAPVVLLHKFN